MAARANNKSMNKTEDIILDFIGRVNNESGSAALTSYLKSFCNKNDVNDIHNITYLGDGDYRIMYRVIENGNLKMKAQLFKMPNY